MENFFRHTTRLILCGVLFLSCSSVRVTMSIPYHQKIDKVALISTYVGIQKSIFPLIDAALVNEKINSIAGAIMPLFSDKINGLRENVAASLRRNLNCEVLYGEELQKTEGFRQMKESFNFTEALYTNDKNFPEIVLAEKDVNPFIFEKAKIKGYFDDPLNYRITVVNICKILKTDYIAVSFTYLQTAPNMLGSSINLKTFLLLFNRGGECIAFGSNFSKPDMFEASELAGYENALDKHTEILKPIVEKFADELSK